MLSVRKGLVAESGRMRRAAMQRFGEKQSGRENKQVRGGEARPQIRGEVLRSFGEGVLFHCHQWRMVTGTKAF